jgi:hypothetical protein
MKKLILSLLALMLFSCQKSTSTPTPTVVSVAEKITKTWTANQVTEGNSVVYAKTGSNNIKAGYSKFKLDLSSKTAVTLTEFDGNSFTGTWELIGDKTLILKSLNPQPTDTNGTIEYTISEASSAVLKLTRTTTSSKTGGVSVAYVLE